jgi:hypothetical protein
VVRKRRWEISRLALFVLVGWGNGSRIFQVLRVIDWDIIKKLFRCQVNKIDRVHVLGCSVAGFQCLKLGLRDKLSARNDGFGPRGRSVCRVHFQTTWLGQLRIKSI